MSVNLTHVTENGMPNLGAIRTLVSPQGEGRLRTKLPGGETVVFFITRNARGVYDAFIESPINFRGRDQSGHKTHRLDLNTDRPRICFSLENPPRDLPTAVALTKYWADCTARYIRTGNWA